jgi:hypothetical protein
MPRRVRAISAACQQGRHVHENRNRPPDDFGELVEKQNETEGGEHLVEMVARIERAQRYRLDQNSDQERRKNRQRQRQEEAAGPLRETRGKKRADHVERAVRQIDHVHDAEHQRKAGGHQKQRDAQLQAVERLFEKKQERQSGDVPKEAPLPRLVRQGRRSNHFILHWPT